MQARYTSDERSQADAAAEIATHGRRGSARGRSRLAALGAAALAAFAAQGVREGSALEPPAFDNARAAEDYSYLRDPANHTGAWWEPLKFLPLDPWGHNRLGLGADLRLRHERYRNNLWRAAPDDAYGLMRLMPFADLRLGRDLRVFGQLIGAWAAGIEPGPGPVDETGVDILQSFARIGLPSDGSAVTVQGGRQLLAYGSERLIGLRFGPNVPQAFDGALARWDSGVWRADAFAMRPVENGLNSFDDRADRSRGLWSLYATRALPEVVPGSGLDLFYIGYSREMARFEQGTGKELRHTLGARFFGASGGWKWDLEGHFQFGEFGAGDIRAWSVATDIRHTFRTMPLRPFVQLRANAISGDRNPNDLTLNTFNAMFPKGKYFGEVGVIGPANLLNLHPNVGIDLGRGWSLSAAAVFYWRESRRDGVYGIPGNPIRASGGSGARYIGTQGELVLGFSPTRGVDIEFAYAVLGAGRFIRETGLSDTVHFWGTEVQLRF